MRLEQLFAEIRSDFSKYDAAELIDEISLVRDATKALRRFGNGITTRQELIVEVKEGKARLPENFHSLFYAGLCEPLGYQHVSEERHNLISSHMYVERTTSTYKWDECDTCCKDQSESVIRENVYFKGDLTTFHYKKPRHLRLAKYMDKNYLHQKCRNRLVKEGIDEISINEFTLTANFETGYVYIIYYGLPRDEEGYISIPDTKTGHLETYIEYHLKRRLAERLIGNGDAVQGLANLYGTFKQEETIALGNATNEIKMRALTPRVASKIARLNRLETLKYDINPEYQWQ